MKAKELEIIPVNFTLSKKVVFPIANEDLSPIAKDLKRTTEFNYYVGICGGGTQNIYLLYLLTKKNSFKLIRVLDVNKEQLLNFIDITNVMKRSKNDLQYISNLTKRPHTIVSRADQTYTRFVRYFIPMFRSKSYGFEETNLKKYTLQKVKRIELVHSDLAKYLNSEHLQKGKYFIYVSNIFTYTGMSWRLYKNLLWNIIKEIRSFKFGIRERADERYLAEELGRILSKNKFIQDGSIALVFFGGFLLNTKNKRIVLFKKVNKRIELVKSYRLPSDLVK